MAHTRETRLDLQYYSHIHWSGGDTGWHLSSQSWGGETGRSQGPLASQSTQIGWLQVQWETLSLGNKVNRATVADSRCLRLTYTLLHIYIHTWTHILLLLESNIGSSAKAVSALNYWAISLVSDFSFHQFIYLLEVYFIPWKDASSYFTNLHVLFFFCWCTANALFCLVHMQTIRHTQIHINKNILKMNVIKKGADIVTHTYNPSIWET